MTIAEKYLSMTNVMNRINENAKHGDTIISNNDIHESDYEHNGWIVADRIETVDGRIYDPGTCVILSQAAEQALRGKVYRYEPEASKTPYKGSKAV